MSQVNRLLLFAMSSVTSRVRLHIMQKGQSTASKANVWPTKSIGNLVDDVPCLSIYQTSQALLQLRSKLAFWLWKRFRGFIFFRLRLSFLRHCL